MLAAMTHPSRVLNLDMKAKLWTCIYLCIHINSNGSRIMAGLTFGIKNVMHYKII